MVASTESTGGRGVDADEVKRAAIRRAILGFRVEGTGTPRRVLFEQARAALRSRCPADWGGFVTGAQLCAWLRHSPQYCNYDLTLNRLRAAGADEETMVMARRLMVARLIRAFGLQLTADCVALGLGDTGQPFDASVNAHLELAMLSALGVW